MNTATADTQHFVARRNAMVKNQLMTRGIRSPRVLKAMRTVPREAFLPQNLAQFAYHDSALPINENQTISQPYIVALMIEALQLESNHRVLDIGTGSGYAAAVLAEIAEEVFSIECIESLTVGAQRTLRHLGYGNVQVIHGDGSQGWKPRAPYDAIVVAAGAPSVPDALKHQLVIGGRLVIPIGESQRFQRLLLIVRHSESNFEETPLADVRFVPLTGRGGWQMTPNGTEVDSDENIP